MVVYGNRQSDLGFILTDDVLVEEFFYLFGCPDINVGKIGGLFTAQIAKLALQQIQTQINAFIADIYAFKLIARDELMNLILCFAAKRAAHPVVNSFCHVSSCHPTLIISASR